MKTKLTAFTRFIIFSLLVLIITSCKKKKEEITPDKTETPVKAIKTVKQSDQSGSSAADGAMDDVNDFINNNITPQASTRLEAYKNLPCGVVQVDTITKNASGKTVYQMKYGDATPCGYSKKKSGIVSFQLIKGGFFNEVGAEFKISFIDYVVEVLATNDIIKVNGDIIITNVNGGAIWRAVTNSETIKHKIRGKYSITYSNGQLRDRTTYQMRTWSSTNSWAGLTFTVDGDTTIAATQISEIGKTLDGNYDFQTEILEAYTWKNCQTTFAGPYVLQIGKARMNVSVPSISPAYFEVEAGYLVADGKTPSKVNDCSTNAYKITTTIGTTVVTEYQLY
jgi:hypothetical protein